VPLVAPAAAFGNGGRGIAGGGEGREATDALLRRFDDAEFDRCLPPPSSVPLGWPS
jgi:hypothetical protein